MSRSTIGVDSETHVKFNQIKVEIAAQQGRATVPKSDEMLIALIQVGRNHLSETIEIIKSETGV
jgi:hypothetical protein